MAPNIIDDIMEIHPQFDTDPICGNRQDAQPWGRLNIKMSFYQYRDPHVKDKTVSGPSYL